MEQHIVQEARVEQHIVQEARVVHFTTSVMLMKKVSRTQHAYTNAVSRNSKSPDDEITVPLLSLRVA